METAIQTENSQVAIIEKSIDVIRSGPQILLANQTRKDKAVEVGRKILSAIQENGMTSELDERSMKFLANVSAATTEMKASRSAVTQIMDNLKKMYTEVENDLDPKKAGTVTSQIQAARDQYAKQVAVERAKKEKEAEEAAAKAKELIELQSQADIRLSNKFNDYLLQKKSSMQGAFNNITLDNYYDKDAKLKSFVPSFEFKANDTLGLYGKYHNEREVANIALTAFENAYTGFENKFSDELICLRDELIDKLPSKYAELQEQKKLADEAAAAEKAATEAKGKAAKEAAEKAAREARDAAAKAEEEKKRREEEETRKMALQNEENKKKAEEEAEIKKQGASTMVLFEKEAAMAEVTVAPEARQGFEITILHPVGYTQIFALWFEHEGKNLPVDKIGNTKLDQMKTWAEKYAHKEGTKIESKFLQYDPSYKAVNRKASK